MTTTWTAIADALSRYGASPRWRRGSNRGWWVPDPSGGRLTVEVTLSPRWCSIAVDRWHTTDRNPATAEPWFREHIWPVIEQAHRQRGGTAILPSGGPTFTSAYPIDRAELLDVLHAWITAELDWSTPTTAGDAA